MTVNNHSDSSSLKRKKIKPYVRWIKETDEWETGSYVEEEIIENEINKEIDMERDLLDAISRTVVKVKAEGIFNHNPNTGPDLKLIDEWLTMQYEVQKPEYEEACKADVEHQKEYDSAKMNVKLDKQIYCADSN